MPDASSSTVLIATGLRASVGTLIRRIRQISSTSELTLSQASILARVEREGTSTAAELAAAEMIRPQSVALTLAILEERELVARLPDPADGRRMIITITPRGKDWVNGERQVEVDYLAATIAQHFDDSEQRTMRDVVPLFNRLNEILSVNHRPVGFRTAAAKMNAEESD